MSQSPLLTDRCGELLLLSLNRPEKLNALDYELIDALTEALDRIEVDAAVRAVVLTGAGERAFSAGADIRCFAVSIEAGVENAIREFVRRGQRLTSRIESFPKPVICAVNGLAYGGGCEIVEAAPLAIASDRASFAKPEVRLGFPPPFGGTQRLPRLIGRKRALGMILTADPIDAAEAARIGLVNAVVPHDALFAETLRLARRIAAQPAVAVSACLASVTRGINLPIDEGLAVEAAQFSRTVPTRDVREGIDAFLEGRPPQFSGT